MPKIKSLLIALSFFYASLHPYPDQFNFSNCIQWLAKSLHLSKKERPHNYIGLISIEDDLLKAKNIIAKLISLSKNPRIKGLIIHIDCTGGRVGTSQAIFSEIKKLKIRKPVIVVIENYCLSGAYYVAAGADYIFALPSSEIGSIGVKSTIEKYKDVKFTDDKISGKMDVTIIRHGKYKDPGNPYTPLENEMLEEIKQFGQKIYNQFISDIAQERNLPIETAETWAEGKSFVGTEALELGLVDAIGDFSDALEKMKELLNISENNLEVMLI